jgi:hypothetical protein
MQGELIVGCERITEERRGCIRQRQENAGSVSVLSLLRKSSSHRQPSKGEVEMAGDAGITDVWF